MKPFWRASVLAAGLVLLLAAHTVAALESNTALTQYAHRVWRFGDADLLGTPQGLAQTADGYIWVSTSNGLFQFDGVRFKRWHAPAGESLPSDSTWYLLGARDGSLYVGTDRGLARITAGHVYTYPGSPRWPGPFVEDARGGVWMGVSGAHSDPSAVCRVLERTLACLGSSDGFACARGLANSIDPSGNLWIGGSEGACRWTPGNAPRTATLTTLPAGSGQSSIRTLAVGVDGSVWGGTQRKGNGAGLLRFSDGAWRTFVDANLDGGQLAVATLLAARTGDLWIGTTDTGLYRLTKNRLEHFDVTEGLSDRNILALFEGREGGIWVVTASGIEYFRDYAVTSFTSREGAMEGHAEAVTATQDGTVFLGSNVLVRFRDGRKDQIRYGDGHPVENVQFLFADSRENVWIGARDRLLLLEGEHGITTVAHFTDSSGKYITYITEDRDHDIWLSVEDTFARRSSLVQVHDSRIVAEYPESSALGGQVLNALAPNPAGGLWVGASAHGLFWFHDGHFERVGAGGFDSRVENLLQAPDGALWIVTQDGFVRYANGQAKTLGTANGLPCNSGVNILDDRHGSTWFYLHCGIVRVSTEALLAWWRDPSRAIHGRVFGPLEGARPNLSNGSSAETPDGHLWSASDYNFQVIDSRHLPFDPLPPPVTLERIAADGRDYLPAHELVLPMHTRQIEVDYTGLSFRIPEQVRFRYRLQGHDTQWIDANTRRQAFYDNLSSGTYLFRVIACNSDGVWNLRGTEVAITILPDWYQTTLFRVSAVLLGVAIAVFVYLYRLQTYAAALKRSFDERLQERTRLARDLHDTLLQTIQVSKLVADDARDHIDDPRATGRALDRLSDWLARASAEGRAALEALRTSSIEANDLTGALRRVAEDCLAGQAARLVVETSGLPRELHPIARDEVYRIGYEAIHNACMHSGATELRVEIAYARKFRLVIRDNGRGIESGILHRGRPGHFGLAGMRERAAGTGGQLSISSSSRGTSVSLVIPGPTIYKPSDGLRSRAATLLRRRL